MGYWIIVTLIVIAGVLVLLAAASADSSERVDDTPVPRNDRQGVPAFQVRQPPSPATTVPVVIFIPRLWHWHKQSVIAPDVPGTSTSFELVERSSLSAFASAVESRSQRLRDSVVVIVAGAADFLAGEPLETVLDRLERLLDQLADLPAMAVIASLPDLYSALAEADLGVPQEPLSETIALWNEAILDVAGSYLAEFSDLSAVPVELAKADTEEPGAYHVPVPEAAVLAEALAPAISRASVRVRSERPHSC